MHSKKRTRLGQKKLNAFVFVMFNKRLQWKYSQKDRDPLIARFVDDEPPNEWIVDDESAPQSEVDGSGTQSGIINQKRRLIHKNASNKAKKARVVAEEAHEEFDSSDSEHEDDENIPCADGSSDHETNVAAASGDNN